MVQLDGTWSAAGASLLADAQRLLDRLFAAFFGYGHLPARALVWVALIWIGATLLYGHAYTTGQMAPNSDVLLTSPEWQDAITNPEACQPWNWDAVGWNFSVDLNEACHMPLHLWAQNLGPNSADDYETFNAKLYALDFFVPLDALGQERAWAPSRDRGWWGWLGYALRMPIQMAGWIITAVGAAVLTGLVGRRD